MTFDVILLFGSAVTEMYDVAISSKGKDNQKIMAKLSVFVRVYFEYSKCTQSFIVVQR